MAESRGKKFEHQIQECFERVDGASVDRIHDQTNGFTGSSNISDFIVYKKPNLYYIECKSVQGNTLCINSNDPKHKYGNITNKQWEGLLEKSEIDGVVAGVICWWVDKDVTKFIPIQALQCLRESYKQKGVRYDIDIVDDGLFNQYPIIDIVGRKKRVFFEYDMENFFTYFER